ncbi:hypothetical protein [Bacillus atrophaeus]|nr:hypothetical protein [Bacillus atrophaeus]ARW07139.1 putative membrane protein YoyF [Bacillus atrophaeus]ATO28625.1 hypothetical protein RA13_11770 [Bacillus atrophaeus]MBT2626879.1 hypothetical protein [Bacillus sp. ISL-32]WNV78035.1 hypothetical protein RUL31_11245 [Bacillus atrophaeus]
MITKMMAALDGDGFDLMMEKVLKIMSYIMLIGCFPYFLYVTVRFLAS